MQAVVKTWLPATALVGALGLIGAGEAQAASADHAYWGDPVAIGQGSARVLVRGDAEGRPTAIAVVMSEGTLDGLPGEPNKDTLPEGNWGHVLPMPKDGPRTGIDHVQVDWNPHGHPPPGIYSPPHFDFHFYGIGRETQAKIAFKGADDPGAGAPAATLLPPDYKFIPETAVPNMGVHAIDTTSPEFHGKPFTATFIYGYYEGRTAFVEPMVTRDFLLSKPDMTSPVKTPAQYSLSGWYPTRYGVRYDPAGKAYVVELAGLKAGGPTGPAEAAR